MFIKEKGKRSYYHETYSPRMLSLGDNYSNKKISAEMIIVKRSCCVWIVL